MRLIDGDELIKSLTYNFCGLPMHGNHKTTYANIRVQIKAEKEIDAVPVVHGWWIDTPNGTETICSYCKADWNVFDNDTYRFNYCPNCGAKMDLED